MIIEDKIYGTFDINEKVLIELIESYPVQRLRGVAQHGLPEETKTDYPYYTRYEHSLGVLLLLKKLDASLEEQTAGLLHDVSHTAFSHVIDWVWGDPSKENYQDGALSDHIKNSIINDILLKHGFDAEKISNLEIHGAYTLLEKEAPDLCADRVDYALRDSYYLLKVDVKECMNDIIVKDNEMIFKSRKYAKIFATWYMECQKHWWMDTEARLRYFLMAEAFKAAIVKGILDRDKLYGEDESVIRLIRESNDADVIGKLNAAFDKLDFVASDSGKISLSGKIRRIDPKFIEGQNILKLSNEDAEYRVLLESELSRLSNKLSVDVITHN